MIRTFIAIELPKHIRDNIAAYQSDLSKEGFPVKWTKPGNIHITLKFIGDVKGETAQDIVSELSTKEPMTEKFDISVSSTGVFPNLKKPRIFWAGVHNGENNLKILAKEINLWLTKYGIPEDERDFKPHLTIGRMKGFKPIAGLEKFVPDDDFEAGEFTAEKFVLIKSVLKPTGAEYTPFGEHRFA